MTGTEFGFGECQQIRDTMAMAAGFLEGCADRAARQAGEKRRWWRRARPATIDPETARYLANRLQDEARLVGERMVSVDPRAITDALVAIERAREYGMFDEDQIARLTVLVNGLRSQT